MSWDGDERRTSSSSGNYVTQAQAIIIAESAGRSAAASTLAAIGSDATTPEARISASADARHLRRIRLASEQFPVLIKRAVIPVVFAAAIAAIWAGVSDSFAPN